MTLCTLIAPAVFAAGEVQEKVTATFSSEIKDGQEIITITASGVDESIIIKGIELPDGTYIEGAVATFAASENGDYSFKVLYDEVLAEAAEETSGEEAADKEATEETPSEEEPSTEASSTEAAETTESAAESEEIPAVSAEEAPASEPAASEAAPADPAEETTSLIGEVQAAEVTTAADTTQQETLTQSGSQEFTFSVKNLMATATTTNIKIHDAVEAARKLMHSWANANGALISDDGKWVYDPTNQAIIYYLYEYNVMMMGRVSTMYRERLA